MYRRPSRKKELAQRTFIYVLMILAVIALLGVLTMTILGYRFNFQTRSVEQTGLIQYDSYPRGARVSVDGRNRGTTQMKNTVSFGQRQFAMHLNGYETWQKTMDIQPSTVTWLSYVRLVPTEKKVETIESLQGLSGVLASPDKRFIAATSVDSKGGPAITMIDFRDSRQPKIGQTTIDQTILSGYDKENPAKSHSFSVVEWSQDSRYFILSHKYTLGESQRHTEWLWVDRESIDAPVNLSTLLNLPISSVRLTDDREVYVLQSNGDVRRMAVSDGTISPPLLSQVTGFDVYNSDTLSFVGWSGKERVAGVWREGWQEPTVLVSAPESNDEQIRIRASEYFSKDTAVVSVGSDLTIYRGVLPASDEGLAAFLQTAKRLTLNRPVSSLQISDNGRFVLAEGKSSFMSYDLERSMASQNVERHDDATLRWLDQYHVWQVDEANQLVMQEFDGVNSYKLMPVSRGFDVLLTRDSRYLYGFLRDGDSIKLQQLQMTVSN